MKLTSEPIQTLRRALPDARRHQREVLLRCVRDNETSAFGVEHRFADVRDIDGFRANVPIRDYAAYAPWLERVELGRSGILTAEPPVMFLTSSGTTATAKRIPATRGYLERCYLPFLATAIAVVDEVCPEARRVDGTVNFRFDLRPVATGGGPPQALGLSQVEFDKSSGNVPVEPGCNAPWARPPVEIEDQLERMYYRVRIAVEHDLRMLVGINPAIVAAVPGLLSTWAERIIADVGQGTMLGRPSQLVPNPARAQELERLRVETGGLPCARVWPNFQALLCWTSGVASLYLDDVRRAFGERVQLISAAIAATECPIAMPLESHSLGGALTITSAFYEFIPAEQDISPNSPTLLADELEREREYHIVITQCGGFYRYALGDVLRVFDHVDGVPQVEYVGRRSANVLAGERVTEYQLLSALRAALERGALRVNNFTVYPETVGTPALQYVIDPLRPLHADQLAALGTALEQELVARSSGYRAARERASAGPVGVQQVTPGRFHHYWVERVQRGTRPAQTKDKILHPDADACAALLGR